MEIRCACVIAFSSLRSDFHCIPDMASCACMAFLLSFRHETPHRIDTATRKKFISRDTRRREEQVGVAENRGDGDGEGASWGRKPTLNFADDLRWPRSHGKISGTNSAAAFRSCGIFLHGNCRASFHSLRATFISMMDEAGIPPHITDAITGHSGGGMHSRYTQPTLAALMDAVTRAIPPL